MSTLAIDLETYSEVDIKKAGLYKYAENCEIILFAYAFDDEPVEIVDFLAGEKLPARILQALPDKDILKTAYNAAFEMNVIENCLNIECNPSMWQCTMVQGFMLGLPGGLDKLGKVLRLAEDKAKMAEGKRLIRYFSVPCKPSKANNGRTRNLPRHDMKKWDLFKTYCKRDVEAERAIRHKLKHLQKGREWSSDWKLWALDQKINKAGVLVDLAMVDNVIRVDQEQKTDLMQEAIELTMLDNPNSRQQVLEWYRAKTGETLEVFDKAARAEILKRDNLDPDVKRLVEIKQLLGKTSVKKYEAMKNAACSDDRVRGMLQFYGASRTGRWAGRLVQLHNLPQNHLDDLDTARADVAMSDYATLQMLYGDELSDILSQLIRTAFIAGKGKRFVVADFSAIEARVIAWLAGETWRMETFAKGGDIYCASASQMFHVPVVKHGINGHLRQKGKVAELACIAEGELVLTDKGLVPIEKVTTSMKLWDGESWVNHEGVMYQGEKEVISYEGLTATSDHLVYLRGESRPVQFGIAAACSAHLEQTGNGRREIRLGGDNQPRETLERGLESLLCLDKMPKLRGHSVAGKIQSDAWQVKGVPALFSAEASTRMAVQETDSCESTMRECKRPRVRSVWCPGNKIRVPECSGSGGVHIEPLSEPGQEVRNRQDRHKQGLHRWKPQDGKASRESGEPEKDCNQRVQSAGLAVQLYSHSTDAESRDESSSDHRVSETGGSGKKKELANHSRKARVYDIRNAGGHHRYTVSGKLVHNCGYGGGVNALKAFGADKMGMTESEMERTVSQWRESSPKICKLWRTFENAAKKALRSKGFKIKATDNVTFLYKDEILTIFLPSGRPINYIKPEIKTEDMGDYTKESLVYKGTSTAGGWGQCFTWGGKLTENIVQATARDCLAEAMLALDKAGYKIVMHVHDEVILEMPYGLGTLEHATEIMGQEIPWAKGLLLRADGYETEYYKKD